MTGLVHTRVVDTIVAMVFAWTSMAMRGHIGVTTIGIMEWSIQTQKTMPPHL